MKNILMKILLLCLLIMTFFISGCSFVSQPSNFYLLTPIGDSEHSSIENSQNDWIIGVGPIHLADHLQRRQIVSHSSANQLTIEEFERWAGELSDNISYVITENLGSMMHSRAILAYPWNNTINLDYQVEIDIQYFTMGNNKQVKLIAVWNILDTAKHKLLHIERSEFTIPVAANTINDQINAQNQALLQLSRAIKKQFNNKLK